MRKRGLGSGFGGLIPTVSGSVPQIADAALDTIVANPNQPRVAFDPVALQELADSIKLHGLLQPLVVTQLDNGDFQLIAGERRMRAAKLAGLERVPVVIKEVSAQEQLELALIENIQRADLDPIEEARAYAVLEDQFGLKHGEIAQRVGKSRSTISETLALLKLPPAVQELVSAGRLTAGHANAVLALKDARKETAAANYIATHGLSVRKAEQYVAQVNGGAGKELASTTTAQRAQPERATAAEDEAIVKALEERFGGLRVQLARAGRGGRLVIHFDNEEMLNSLYDVLMAT